MVQSWVIGAVVLTLCYTAAQTTAHAIINEALSLEDVRRPVYRGNVRYTFKFSSNNVKSMFEKGETTGKNSLNISQESYAFKNVRNGLNNSLYYSEDDKKSLNESFQTNRIKRGTGRRASKKIEGSDDDDSWSLVELHTDPNQTKIIQKFVQNSLYDLDKKQESLDNLILSHTEAGDKHIQLYPEGSPTSWIDMPVKPNVILIEDVHPSKLPKPYYTQIALYEKPTGSHNKPSWTLDESSSGGSSIYGRPTVTKPSHYYEPATTRPPVTKPSHYYEPVTTKPPVTNPSHYYEPVTTKPPVTKPSHYYEPVTTRPPVTRPSHYYESVTTKPPVTKPSHYYEPVTTRPPVTKPSHYYEPVTTRPPVTKPSHYNEPVTTKPPVTKPSHYYEPVTTRPPVTRPSHYYGPPTNTKPSDQYDNAKPVVGKPVYHYPESPKPPYKPIYVYPKPVTVRPAIEHETEPSYRPVITSTTHLPKPIIVTEVVTQYTPVYIKPPPEPPPKRPPPPSILVIESPTETHIDCGTVQIINSASFKDCPDVSVVLNAASAASSTTPAAPDTHALVAPEPSPGVGLTGLVPVPPPPLPPPALVPPSNIIPIVEDDEEYDEDDDDDDDEDDDVTTKPSTSTYASTAKPSRPTSILGYLMNTLPFLGPISVSLWIIFLGPLSFILIGIMGVASFLFPWLAPGLIFRRLGRRSINQNLQIPQTARLFERYLREGHFKRKGFK